MYLNKIYNLKKTWWLMQERTQILLEFSEKGEKDYEHFSNYYN